MFDDCNHEKCIEDAYFFARQERLIQRKFLWEIICSVAVLFLSTGIFVGYLLYGK